MKNYRKQLIPDLRFPEFAKDEGWEMKSVDYLCEILNNLRKPITGSTRQKGEYPYYGASGIIDYVDAYIFDERLLLVGEDGAKWNAFEKTAFLVEGKYWVNNHAHVLKPVKINDKLLESYLVKLDLLPYITGAAPPKLTLGKLKEIPIPFIENPKEQQKIASCLSSLDELLIAQKEKLELLKNHKKGLMQNLFPQEGETVPKFRFPEFENDGDWEEKIIGDFIESHKGGASLTPSDFVTQSTFEVIPKKAITAGGWLKLDKLNPTYCSELFFNNNHQSIIDNSYLVTTLRDLVPSGPSIGYIVQYTGKNKMILAQGVYGLKVKKEILPEFLVQYSNTTHYRKLINAAMVGSTQVHIRNGEFFKIPITVSLVDEQRKITSCLASLDRLISAQREKIDSLEFYKKGLMQGLFPKINN